MPAAAGDKVHPHAFSITSQAEEDASPVTTLLAAASEEERTRWVTAIARAIRSCQPQPERTAKFQPASKEEAVLYQKSALQLRLLLEYMSIPASRFRGAEEDKPRLVALVMQGRVARKMAAAAADTAEAVEERVRLEREERARLEARTIDELWAPLARASRSALARAAPHCLPFRTGRHCSTTWRWSTTRRRPRASWSPASSRKRRS